MNPRHVVTTGKEYDFKWRLGVAYETNRVTVVFQEGEQWIRFSNGTLYMVKNIPILAAFYPIKERRNQGSNFEYSGDNRRQN